MAVRVVTDSTNCLADDELSSLHITRVPLFVHDGDELRPETEIDLDAFYRRLADTKVLPTSSQPSPEAFFSAYRALVEEGHEVLSVLMSSGMSGTVQSAELAAGMVRSECPDASISVFDSESNCMQEGFAVLSAAQAASEGAALGECEEQARRTVARTRFLFSPHTLEYLGRGGRISGASALLGSLLQIMPVLTVEHGETTVAAKVRTRAKALAHMAAMMRADVDAAGLRRCVVHSIADVAAATDFAREFVEPIAGGPVAVVPIGPVIGLHVGPAVGVVYETLEPLR